jgi:hypothetical protein
MATQSYQLSFSILIGMLFASVGLGLSSGRRQIDGLGGRKSSDREAPHLNIAGTARPIAVTNEEEA